MRQESKRLVWMLPVTGVLLMAADIAWKDKPIPAWTQEDVREILDDSPWAKTVKAGVTRLEGEDERREGGKMGQDRGVGFDGINNKGARPALRSAATPAQFITLHVRWETALPMRMAQLKSGGLVSPSPEDGYVIAVYGVPGSFFTSDPKKLGDPFKKDAVLKRDGKRDVRPSRAEVFQREEGAVVVYSFPLSAEISRKDGRVEFSAQIGRIVLDQVFDLEAMQFQGNLEL
jgi:hypothetical protein